MEFREVDRLPDYEFGYWDETIERWHSEGLPLRLKDNRDVELYFKLEGVESLERLPIATGIWPQPPGRILREDGGEQLIDDGIGGIYLRKRYPYYSVPHYIRYPIKNRADWERLRPFLDPETPGRLPLLWDEIVETYREIDYPLGVFVGSLYGWLRNWMGVERLSVAFYREPDWVEDMMDTLTNLWVKVLSRALRGLRVDYAWWWEDMCYNRGPLLSVKLFEEFMVPRYRKVTELLADHGVKVNVLDCDGNIADLVPGWLRGGINCMFPLEAAHTDFFELRRRYGRELLLIGGVDKRALMKSKEAIDAELLRLKPLVEEGGYIPTVDHRVPPEVSLENYVYYLKAKRKLIGRADPP
jgi:uroporphyrinogen decarboxylase